MKAFLYILGLCGIVWLAWRLTRNILNDKPRATSPIPRYTRQIDDNAPIQVYATTAIPLASEVQPNAGNIITRANDPYIPPLYTLPALGPNGIS